MDPLAGALVALGIVVFIVVAASVWAVHHRGRRPTPTPYPREPDRTHGTDVTTSASVSRADESRT